LCNRKCKVHLLIIYLLFVLIGRTLKGCSKHIAAMGTSHMLKSTCFALIFSFDMSPLNCYEDK